MKEMRTTLGRIAVYYLLLAINIIFCANVIADVFPTRNLSAIYLLTLSVCLVLYYSHRVIPSGGLSVSIKMLSWMALALILLRAIKYSVVSEIGVLARHAWYLYYAPILLLPLFLFKISLLVTSHKLNAHALKIWYFALALTVVLIALVLTNDLHRQAFVFKENFEGWDEDYTYGWLFYVVNAWQFALSFAAMVILIVKSRVGAAKQNAWVILIPFGIGAVMYALLFTGTMPRLNGTYIVEFPEAHVFTAAAILECCMQLGLIPTNNGYGKLFNNLSISAQITDQNGTPVYASATSTPLTAEEFALKSGSRLKEHIVMHKMKIQGGYGIWQVDLAELDRLNEELEEAKERLSEETELIRLQGELKEKQAKIEQRTEVYDAIAKSTQKQSQAISYTAKKARETSDPAQKNAYRRRITLLAAYIKRYANLMLLSQENDVLRIDELALSFAEVLRYLNLCGIPSEYVKNADCKIKSKSALAVFEAFETMIESNYSSLAGVFVNLSGRENAVIKVTFEHMTKPLSEGLQDKLLSSNVKFDVQKEDDVTYVCFTAEGGAK